MEGSFVQHSVRVLQELNKQRESGRYCDATLAVGSLVFKAHWSVLACCSSFFRSMYDGCSSKVILPETFVEIFALLLDFFYTGHLAVTPENWGKLLLAAKELSVPEAVRLCQEFKPKHLDSGDQNGQPLCESDPGSKEPADAPDEPAPKAAPTSNPVQEASPSPCTRGSTVAQGQRERPCLLRERLKRAPKTHALSNAGEGKSPPEGTDLNRPLKRGATEDAGASYEVACGVMSYRGIALVPYNPIFTAGMLKASLGSKTCSCWREKNINANLMFVGIRAGGGRSAGLHLGVGSLGG